MGSVALLTGAAADINPLYYYSAGIITPYAYPHRYDSPDELEEQGIHLVVREERYR